VALLAFALAFAGAVRSDALQFYDRWQDTLSGNEPTFDPNYCGSGANYDVVVVTPTVSGEYAYVDLSRYVSLDIVVEVFEGSFDPGNPAMNFVISMDDETDLTLVAGTTYYLVVFPFCGTFAVGAWDFALTGPSALGGTDPVQGYSGDFTGTDPIFASPACGGDPTSYAVAGPFLPPVTGIYAYGDMSISYDVDIQIEIYEGSFDPANPNANYVETFDDQGAVELRRGTPYYLVVGPLSCSTETTGAWDFVIALGIPTTSILEIPTLGPLGLGALALALVALALVALRRRKGAAA